MACCPEARPFDLLRYEARRAAFRRGADLFEWVSPFDPNRDWQKQPIDHGALPRLPAEQRLALEMAVHEESERRALEGELSQLEQAWREAEAIAAIADRLTTPRPLEARLDEMKAERHRRPGGAGEEPAG